MALYSWILTLIALIVVPVQVAITIVGASIPQAISSGSRRNARTQSHLIEVLTGIQTVKAQNVEIVSRWKWQERYGDISTVASKKQLWNSTWPNGSSLQKLSQLMVLWIGASLVLNGELTLGQLIAFRIISGW